MLSRKKSKNNSKKSKKNFKQSPQTNVKIRQISKNINYFFKKIHLNEIAKQTKFLIRDSKITPFLFLYAMSMGFFGNNISLDMLAIHLNTLFFSITLTGSSLCLRMSSKKSVLYLKTCFEEMLKIQWEGAFSNHYSKIFSMFNGVYIEDSTGIKLNKKNRKFMKGSGGAGTRSSVKLHWLLNICSNAAISVEIFQGAVPDQKLAKKLLKSLKKGALYVRDLGYFGIPALREIEYGLAYYLSRLPKSVSIYLNENDENEIDPTYFKNLTKGGKSVTLPVFIGKKERFLTNIVVQKVPKWVLKQRIKFYKKKNRLTQPQRHLLCGRDIQYLSPIYPRNYWRNHLRIYQLMKTNFQKEIHRKTV